MTLIPFDDPLPATTLDDQTPILDDGRHHGLGSPGPGLHAADVICSGGPITLAEVLASAESGLAGTARRDTRSAFAALARAGTDLAGTVASPARVRAVLDGLAPARLGLSAKRQANVRSLVIRAVERFGQPRRRVTTAIALAPAWRDLMATIQDRQHRWALSRLACFASAAGVAPGEVTGETLRGLAAALEAEEMIKAPRGLLKHTIAVWNMCGRRVPGWPDVRLASPFKEAPAMIPLDAFPARFRADVAAWEARMRHPDPLDPAAPVRALREPTLEGYRFTFRRIASALVRAGAVTVEEVTGLDVLVAPEHVRVALREYLPEAGSGRGTDYVHKMATQLVVVARTHLGHDEARLKPLQAMADRLRPPGGRRMGERNRQRLGQFDDPQVVRRLLRFPEAELARALRQANPLRRARGVERALAISLAIFTGLRVKNLRTLHLDGNLRRSGGRVFVHIPEEEAKTHRVLDLELPAGTIALLDLFLRGHRTLLPGAASRHLFPGPDGAPRSYSAMRDALARPLRRHAGIVLSPHLFRHIGAKIVIERQPELALDVSRRLGHASLTTTFQSYLGTEGPAASRRINDHLEQVRDDESVRR